MSWWSCSSAMILLPLVMLAAPSLQAMPRPIKIAAIFDEDTNMRHDLMFVNAVKSVNKLRGLLRGVTLVGIIPSPVQYLQSLLSLPNTDLSQVPMIRKIPPDNSFIAEKVTCQVASFPFYLCQRFFPKVWLQFLDLAPSATLTTSSQSVITVRFHSSRREAQVGLGICTIWVWMMESKCQVCLGRDRPPHSLFILTLPPLARLLWTL